MLACMLRMILQGAKGMYKFPDVPPTETWESEEMPSSLHGRIWKRPFSKRPLPVNQIELSQNLCCIELEWSIAAGGTA